MAVETERAELHVLVDALPAERLTEAKAAIWALADPVLLSLLTAPDEDEELSADELADLAEAEAELANGTIEYVADDEVATQVERASLAATHEAYLRGELISHDEAMRQVGL